MKDESPREAVGYSSRWEEIELGPTSPDGSERESERRNGGFGAPDSKHAKSAGSGKLSEEGVPLTNEAFVGLLIANDHRVRAFIASLLLPTSEVDDVFQNTSVTAFGKISSFRFRNETPDEEFVRWVCTIARYEVLRYYQKARRAKVVFSSALVDDLADMQLQMQAELGERQEALSRCIEKMPVKQRELIKLRYGAGEAVVRIATRLGLTPSSVYKSLATVRAALMRCIESDLRSSGPT